MRGEREADAGEYERRLQVGPLPSHPTAPNSSRLLSTIHNPSVSPPTLSCAAWCLLPSLSSPQEAVDSAEKWKQFAEGLQARAEGAEERYGAAQAELAVS